ncbi:MAG: cold shock domain-containing protein [Methylobacter sp.]
MHPDNASRLIINTEKGPLVRWFDDKGFGFIKPKKGKGDIFIPISALKGMNRKPIIGDAISWLTMDIVTAALIRSLKPRTSKAYWSWWPQINPGVRLSGD